MCLQSRSYRQPDPYIRHRCGGSTYADVPVAPEPAPIIPPNPYQLGAFSPDFEDTIVSLQQLVLGDPVMKTFDGARTLYVNGERTNTHVLAVVNRPNLDNASESMDIHSTYTVRDHIVVRFNVVDTIGLRSGAFKGEAYDPAKRFVLSLSATGKIVDFHTTAVFIDAIKYVNDYKLPPMLAMFALLGGGGMIG